jgi:hypothetical protein
MVRFKGGACLPCALVLGLAGYGGSDAATIGGSLSGLGTGLSVTLQSNGGDSLTLTSNAGFGFATTNAGDGVYAAASRGGDRGLVASGAQTGRGRPGTPRAQSRPGSQWPRSAAARYVVSRKRSKVASGSAAVRTTS